MSMSGHYRSNPQFLGICEAPILAKARPSSINSGKSAFFNTWSYILECRMVGWLEFCTRPSYSLSLCRLWIIQGTKHHSLSSLLLFIPLRKLGVVIVISVFNYSKGKNYITQFSQDGLKALFKIQFSYPLKLVILGAQFLSAKIF